MEERRKQWNFVVADGGWAWRVVHLDGREEMSPRVFKTLKECTDDAATHGYVVWKTEAERRRGS